MSITIISNLLFSGKKLLGITLSGFENLERKEITRNSSLGTYSNMLNRIKSSNTKKQKGGICTLFQYYYYKPHSLTHKHEIKCVKIIMLPRRQKLVSSTKTNWCMAESSHNVVFFFQTEASSTYHTKKSKTAVTAAGETRVSWSH